MNDRSASGARAVLIIGGSSVITILLGVLRTKVAAVLLGPAGVGIIGLLQQLLSTSTTLVGLGLSTAGAREIAAARVSGSKNEQQNTRSALLITTTLLAIIGALAFFLSEGYLRDLVIGVSSWEGRLTLLALGIALTIGGMYQQAIINGHRRVLDFALLNISAALFSTFVAAVTLWFFREDGMVGYVIALPLASFLFGFIFVRRTKVSGASEIRIYEIYAEIKVLVRLGASVMISGVVVSIGYLVLRSMLQRELGSHALGLFTGAWLVVQYNLSFLFSAITADYFPRLTGVVSDKKEVNRLINEQIKLTLLFAGPLCLCLMACAPYALSVLYSMEFVGGVGLMRWLIIGAILMVTAQPIGFALLAFKAGRAYFAVQSTAMVTFLLVSMGLLPHLGVIGVGIAYIFMHAINLTLSLICIGRIINIDVSRSTLVIFLSSATFLVGFWFLSIVISPPQVAIFGVFTSVGWFLVLLKYFLSYSMRWRDLLSFDGLRGLLNKIRRS